MEEFLKYGMLFLYMIAFCTGAANITLNFAAMGKNRGSIYGKLLPFNIAFFIYLGINFVLFFSRMFVPLETLNTIAFAIFDLSYACLIYCWITYLAAVSGDERGLLARRAVLISGLLYVIVWFAVTQMYLDSSQHVYGMQGKAMAAFAEVAVLITITQCTLFYVLGMIKKGKSKGNGYAALLGSLMMLYFLWFFIYDMDSIFRFVGPSAWRIYPFDAVAPVCLAVNIVICTYNYPPLFNKAEVKSGEQILQSVEGFIKKFALTAREAEVLFLICSGSTNSDIAQKLSISNFTVKRHINNIFRKASVRNRAELINQIKPK